MITQAEKEYAQQKLDLIKKAVDEKDLDRHYIWKDENHYRTTYKDLCDGKETAVRSDFPSGYGGHVPSIRHDILHRGTEFDTTIRNRINPDRDYIEPFQAIKAGVPCFTQNPLSKAENPKFGTIPLTNDLIVPPYATLKPLRPPPNYRNAEAMCDALTHGQNTSTTYKAVGTAVETKLPEPSPPRFLRTAEGTYFGKTTRDAVQVDPQNTVIINNKPYDRSLVATLRAQGVDPNHLSEADLDADQQDSFANSIRERVGQQYNAPGAAQENKTATVHFGETGQLLRKEAGSETGSIHSSQPASAAAPAHHGYATGPLPDGPIAHAQSGFRASQGDAVKASTGPGHAHLANVTSNYTSTFVVNERRK